MDVMKEGYIACANLLGYGDLTKIKTTDARRAQLITECADGYILATKNNDNEKRSEYISALMILFWGEISKMQSKCKAVKEYEYEDFAMKLYECIEIACSYQAWKDGTKNAEQCIRSVIASRGAAAILYESNLDKNKSNVNSYSLDLELDDDSSTTYLDTVEDDSFDKQNSELTATSIVQEVLDRGDLVCGIVLDNIAFSDCLKETKETKTGIEKISNEDGEIIDEKEYRYTVKNNEFSERVLVKTLSDLPKEYKDYFVSKYKVNEDAIEAAINRIRTVDNSKLYKMVRAALVSSKSIAANWAKDY